MKKILFLYLLLLGSIAFLSAQNTEYLLSSEYKDALRQEFYRLVNEHRRANGQRELEVHAGLEEYADIRAAEQRARFGHTRPDGTPAGSGWYNSRNIMNTRFAENAISVHRLNSNPAIAANYIFTRWKNSAGHNRHMLYNFSAPIQMALGIVPMLESNGRDVSSGAIWATGFDEFIGVFPDNLTAIGQNAYFNSLFTRVVIPSTVTSIGHGGFDACRFLGSLTIPASVTRIDARAFNRCDELDSVTFEGIIDANNFSSNLSFPGDLRSKYLAGGPGTYTRQRGSNIWTKQ
ncbi:MAG: leucine-rich repeat protein [Treponema sp.]|nr:leucine-rich repeat protein [Treponema sp.]